VPGQLDIDICGLGVDYYTGNLHKWCYVPPAVAFLWVASPNNLKSMHYPVISHAYNQGLLEETGFVGTRDYSCFAVVPSAVEFHRTAGSKPAGAASGSETAFEYTHRLITEAALMLAAAWGTELGQPVDSCGSLMMVGLPAVRAYSYEVGRTNFRVHALIVFALCVRRRSAPHCRSWASWSRN
jgi:isopenicillin-N epimerase